MNTYTVNAWISTGYTFNVQAESAEEAIEKVESGQVSIDYADLAQHAEWDFGDIYESDVNAELQEKSLGLVAI